MSQNQEVLQALKQKPITPIEALNEIGCFRLAARIYDLKLMGHDILTVNVERNGKHFAEYHYKGKR